MIRNVSCGVVFTVAATIVPALSAGSQTPADIVRNAAQQLETERHGVIVFHHLYSYEEHGPGHNKTIVTESLRLWNDGRLTAVKILSQVTNGKSASAQDLAKLQADTDKSPPSDEYRLPLDAGALQEYRFDVASTPCTDCPANTTAIQFTSLVRDANHADGTIFIDASSHQIVRLDFHPSALPPHADSGTISIRFGRVLPDLWDVEDTREHYTGHMLFIHGWADIAETDSDYRRLGTLDEGKQVLSVATPAPSPSPSPS